MPSNQQQILLECDCGCGCIGSCFPIDRVSNPNLLEDIPWTISAPSCAAIDGTSGVFSPFGGYSSWEDGNCGPCVCYESITYLSLPGKMKLQVGGDDGDPETVDPPATCVEFDCTIELKLYLATDSSIEGCCNIVLVVELLSVVNGLALTSGDIQNVDTISCIPQATPVDNDRFRQFALDSCTCLDDEAGFVGLMDLSRITWTCTLGNHPSGACIGQSLCCVLFGCSLSGATLAI